MDKQPTTQKSDEYTPKSLVTEDAKTLQTDDGEIIVTEPENDKAQGAATVLASNTHGELD